MIIVLTILTSGIMAALFCLSFYLGYEKGIKSKDKEGMTLDSSNVDEIREILKWRNYEGR